MTWGKDSASRARGLFEEQWPDLVRGLDQALRSRHVPVSRREDIIQETGLRLFVRWADLDPDRPVWPFALTIALNLMKDEQRMQARRNAAAQPLEDGIERGVEEEALARLELTDVQAALQKLTPAQRSVLLADLGELPYDNRAPAALKMLRMRARRTLRSVIGRASALVPIAGMKARNAFNSLNVSVQRSSAGEVANLLVASTLGIAGAATIIGAALGGANEVGRSPREAPREVVSVASNRSASAPPIRAGGLHDRAQVWVSPRNLRGVTMGSVEPRSRRSVDPVATVEAEGTGIDEEPSLRSNRFRVAVFARAVVSERETRVDYEVEQANPVCGSPTGSDDASRTCLRAEAPSARGRGRVAGRRLPKIGR